MKNDGNWFKVVFFSEYEQIEFNNDIFNCIVYNGILFINIFRGMIWIKGKYYFFKKKLIIGYESYYQFFLEWGDNYCWWVDLGLEIFLIKYLNFRANFFYIFESIVIEGQWQEDILLIFGLMVKNF